MQFRGKDQQFSFEDYRAICSKKSVLNVCFPAVRFTSDRESKYHIYVVPALVDVASLNKMLIIRKTVQATLRYFIKFKL